MPKFPFISDTTAFNLVNARSLAQAANLAYEEPAKSERTALNEWGMDQYRFFRSNGTQGFVTSNKEIILVAFRGTESDSPKDWLTDLDLDLEVGPMGGQVHSGFLGALEEVWTGVERTISMFRGNSPKSLWFTGHSLGAALATLAVAKLKDQDQPVDGLYTFGQPRTGDRTFARNFNLEFKSHTFRFVNNNDIVTRIPPRSLNYSHLGTFKYFKETGELVDDPGFWNRFLDRMHGRIADILEWGTDGIKDHSMTDYEELVGAAPGPRKRNRK